VKKLLTNIETTEFLEILKDRFSRNMEKHPHLEWEDVLACLKRSPESLWSLKEMDRTGGEPDVVDFDKGKYIFIDCARESPAGRRSLCYDSDALESRKANKPSGSAKEMANEMGVQLLDETQYRKYHPLILCDNKTSSWIETPDDVRQKGGAMFCDFRYGRIFTYHNGAESYYAARGFRAIIKV